ncbi:DUF4177 domain-containing protein [Loktanella salsilacus]|uniref:DUF4177 domain-containing protein n=1 Tax=Loktanella salsilacus TaxID=195913 RepID=UPI003703EDD3
MVHYDYKVVPAPKRGEKAKGLRAAEDRYALALTNALNAQAALGWEYQRTETLPAEEREGLLGKATVYQNMMVFRRAKPEAKAAPAPAPMIEDKRAEAATAPVVAAPAVTAPAAMPVAGSATTAAEPKSDKTPGVGAADPAHKG